MKLKLALVLLFIVSTLKAQTDYEQARAYIQGAQLVDNLQRTVNAPQNPGERADFGNY